MEFYYYQQSIRKHIVYNLFHLINNSFIMKVFVTTVMIMLLAVATSSNNLIGGYARYTELDSQDFKRVLAFAKSNRPILGSLTPTAVSRQLVNGYNYRITFAPTNGCAVTVTVYATFQLELTQTEYSSSPINCFNLGSNLQQIKNGQPQAISAPQQMVFGGFGNSNELQSQEFKPVLAFIRKNNLYLANIAPSSLRTQIVAGKNFRVTFKAPQNCAITIVVYRNLQDQMEETSNFAAPQNCNARLRGIRPNLLSGGASPLAEPESFTPISQIQPEERIIRGGYSSFTQTDSKKFQGILNFIYSLHPEIKNLKPKSVQTQLVSGTNYKVLFQVAQKCSLQVVIYEPLQGSLSETTFQSLPDNCNKVGLSRQDDNLSIAADQPLLPGGFSDSNQANSLQFQGILTFIRQKHPEYATVAPIKVQKQLVNGFNYRVSFPTASGCTEIITIYSTFDGELSQTNIESNCPQKIIKPIEAITKLLPLVVAVNGGYKVETDWKKPQIVKVLNWIGDQYKGELVSATLTEVQSQLVNEVNYKIKYTLAPNGHTLTFIIYSNFNQQLSLSSLQTTSHSPTNPDIKAALTYILSSRPSLNLYKLTSSKVSLSDRSVQLTLVDTYSTKVSIIIELPTLSSSFKERSFNVNCFNAVNNCNDKIALNIYKANEDLFKKYPNLKHFVFSSFKVYQRPANVQIIVEILMNKKTSQTSLITFMINQTDYRLLNYVPIKS